MSKNVSDALKNIDTFLYKYKKSAQDSYGVDDKKHVGIVAQQLEQNPVTESAVVTMEDGHKEVDIKELTMQNTAMLADVVRRIEAIENKIGDK
jgi:hypothetical protein